MNPDLPVLDTVALSDFLAVSSLPQRIAGSVTSALGLLGLILASIGLYGLRPMRCGSADAKSASASPSGRARRR